MRLWDCHTFIYFINLIHFNFGSKFQRKAFYNIPLCLLHLHHMVLNCLHNMCQDINALHLRTESPWSQCSCYTHSISARKKTTTKKHACICSGLQTRVWIIRDYNISKTWCLVPYLRHSAIPDWSVTLIFAIVALNAFNNFLSNFIQSFLNLEWGENSLSASDFTESHATYLQRQIHLNHIGLWNHKSYSKDVDVICIFIQTE